MRRLMFYAIDFSIVWLLCNKHVLLLQTKWYKNYFKWFESVYNNKEIVMRSAKWKMTWKRFTMKTFFLCIYFSIPKHQWQLVGHSVTNGFYFLLYAFFPLQFTYISCATRRNKGVSEKEIIFAKDSASKEREFRAGGGEWGWGVSGLGEARSVKDLNAENPWCWHSEVYKTWIAKPMMGACIENWDNGRGIWKMKKTVGLRWSQAHPRK